MLTLVAVLAWLAWFDKRSEQAPTNDRLSATELASITHIELTRNDATPIVFRRNADGWFMQQPIMFSADDFQIDALLGVLHAPAKALVRGPHDDPGFGLRPPEAVLRADGITLAIGGVESVSKKRYVALDQALFLIEDAWYHHLFSAPQRYLDPRPAVRRGVPQRIRTPTFEWRRIDGRWQRTPPDDARSADDGQALAERWAQARAVFVDALDASAKWSGEVSLEFADGGAALTFRVARRGELVLLARESPAIQYQLTKAQAVRLLSDQPSR